MGFLFCFLNKDGLVAQFICELFSLTCLLYNSSCTGTSKADAPHDPGLINGFKTITFLLNNAITALMLAFFFLRHLCNICGRSLRCRFLTVTVLYKVYLLRKSSGQRGLRFSVSR